MNEVCKQSLRIQRQAMTFTATKLFIFGKISKATAKSFDIKCIWAMVKFALNYTFLTNFFDLKNSLAYLQFLLSVKEP